MATKIADGKKQLDLMDLFSDCCGCQSLNCNAGRRECHMKIDDREGRVNRVRDKILALQ